jgi:hypothetical protein
MKPLHVSVFFTTIFRGSPADLLSLSLYHYAVCGRICMLSVGVWCSCLLVNCLWTVVCFTINKETGTKFRWPQCYTGLCATTCFKVWQQTDNRMEILNIQMEMLNTQMWLKFKIGFKKPICEFIKNEIMHGLSFWTVFIIRLKFVLQFAVLFPAIKPQLFYVTLYSTEER